jgi:hypothetical protein
MRFFKKKESGMRYNKQDVLTSLRDNRQAHKTAYRAARSTWRDKVVERYEDLLSQFDYGVFKNAANPLNVRPRPKHHLADYDAAIARVEAAVEDSRGTVHLSEREYNQYVRDEWDWATSDKAVDPAFTFVVA